MRYEDSLKTTHASAALQVLCTLSGTSSEQERNQEIETHDAIDNMSAAESAANAIHEIGAMGPFSLDNMRKHLTHDSLHNESFATETRKHKKIIIPRRFSICIDRDFFELNFAARNEQKLLINRISTSICCDISIDPPSGRKLVFGEEAKEFYELEATGASGKLDAVVTLLRERVVRNFPKMRDQDFSRAVKTYRY